MGVKYCFLYDFSEKAAITIKSKGKFLIKNFVFQYILLFKMGVVWN